jgi:hypothetical protein
LLLRSGGHVPEMPTGQVGWLEVAATSSGAAGWLMALWGRFGH